MMAYTRIDVGPIHPGTRGALRLVAYVDGDTVRHVEPHIGFLHRGVEKLMEKRSYMQSIAYVEKLDYAAPLCWGDLYISVVEKALGIEVNEKAQYLRVVMLEFQRIASHLLWLDAFCSDLKLDTAVRASRERAMILKLLEDASGGRMSCVNLRPGGFHRLVPPDFVERAHDLTDYLTEKISGYPGALDSNPVFMERTMGVGVLSKDDAIDLGVSGPVLRASGVGDDVRMSKPYYIYGKLRFNVPIRRVGDAYSRYKVRLEEIHQSIRIIRQALDAMPQSGDEVGMPIRLRASDARPDPVMVSRELPRGEGMIYMVPGKQSPQRIALRPPSLSNLAALPRMCEGAKLSDLFVILGSLDVAMGEADR